MMEYEITAKMLFIAVVFFWSGWQFRASRYEKQIISMNEKFEATILNIQSNINKELEYSRIDRDIVMQQQEEVLSSLKAYNQHYLEMKKLDKKNATSKNQENSTEAKSKLDSLKKNKGIKK